MKAYLFLFIFAIMLFTVACSKRSNIISGSIERIPISIDKRHTLKLSSFVDSVEIIPLETTTECLIGRVRRIIYKNGKYYIRVTEGMQNGKLFVFDSLGKFLFKIDKVGNGPGEYTDLSDFALTEESQIKIASFFKIITYDSLGNFLYEKRIDQPFKEFWSSKNNEYLVYNSDAILKDRKLLSTMNKDDEITDYFFQVPEKEINKSDVVYISMSLFPYKNSFYFAYPYSDTIYQITDKEISYGYYVDYGDKRIPSDLFEAEDKVKEMGEKKEHLDDFGFTYAFGMTDDYVFIGSFDKKYDGYLSFYSKHTQKVLTGHKIIDDLFLVGNTISLKWNSLPGNLDGNYLLWHLEPRYLIKGYQKLRSQLSEPRRGEFKQKYPQLVDLCERLQEDDNPVLLRIKVKQF